ncbi:MAG: N-acetyl-gamma-glutamyl-phosphate reductase, partial [Acidobacteria bacterium]
MKKIRAAIFGGSGYGGSELLRILLQHPEVEISVVYANEHAGKPIGNVHRNLYGLTNLIFEPIPDDLSDLSLDVIFLALPHSHAMRLVKKIPENIKIIDLSGDFRLKREEFYMQFYGWQHEAIELQREFVYGLSETNRQLIKSCK